MMTGEKKEDEETPPWESESGAEEERKHERTTIRTAKLIYVRRQICRTIAGLPVEEIVITGPPLPSFRVSAATQAEKSEKGEKSDRAEKTEKGSGVETSPRGVVPRRSGLSMGRRQVVVITSRVHPGESNSSVVFGGLLRFLLSDCKEAEYLRGRFVFRLVPCLNPDGVICGNYRSSLAGVDLNRQWQFPDKALHSTIWTVKEMMRREKRLKIYVDLHGHSKKMNSFFYGCNVAAQEGFTSWTKVRLLPRIMARITHLVNIKDSRFRIENFKVEKPRD